MRDKRGKAYIDEVSKVVDGLQGDAFTTAQDLGLEELWKGPTDKGKEEDGEFIPEKTFTSGIDKLITAMRAMVFPHSTQEAKVMFRHYCTTSGTLSRQYGESMKQYVARRKRCWNLICELDKEGEMSEGCRADMLLRHSRLSKRERATIQASIQNGHDFQKMADALMLLYPRIHVTEVHPRLQDKEQHCRQSKDMNEDDRVDKSLATSMPSASSEMPLVSEACTKEEENIAGNQGGEIVDEASSSEDKRSEKRQASQDERKKVESDGGVQEKVADMQSACAAQRLKLHDVHWHRAPM